MIVNSHDVQLNIPFMYDMLHFLHETIMVIMFRCTWVLNTPRSHLQLDFFVIYSDHAI